MRAVKNPTRRLALFYNRLAERETRAEQRAQAKEAQKRAADARRQAALDQTSRKRLGRRLDAIAAHPGPSAVPLLTRMARDPTIRHEIRVRAAEMLLRWTIEPRPARLRRPGRKPPHDDAK